MTKQDVSNFTRWVEEMEPGLPICCVHDGMMSLQIQDAVYEEDQVVSSRCACSDSQARAWRSASVRLASCPHWHQFSGDLHALISARNSAQCNLAIPLHISYSQMPRLLLMEFAIVTHCMFTIWQCNEFS